MRALLAAVIAMGVLILVATAGMIAVVVHRATAPRGVGVSRERLAAPVRLDEPAGTRIARSEATGERLVLQLAGGGPDRVVVLRLPDGAVVARVSLAR